MPPADEREKNARPPGRIRHDANGRAVWEWAKDSGRHAIDSTSRLLKRLDIPGLKISEYDPAKEKAEAERLQRESSAQNKAPLPTFGGPREKDPLAHSQRSFNPYDNRAPKRGAPVAGKPVPPATPRITQPARPAKKPGLLARLFGRG